MKPLLVLLSLATSLLAQEAPGLLTASAATPHITVTGTAITEVTPDRLVWSLVLKNTGPELAKVADSHTSQLGGVLKNLQNLGIDSTTVQTSQMEFGENRVYRNSEHVKDGYYASTAITFKLADLGKYKEVWLRLASLSDLSVSGVSYEHSKRIEVQKDTRKKALLAAKEKAGIMAETLDTRIGAVLSITEETDASAQPVYSNRLITPNIMAQSIDTLAGDSSEGSIAPGTIPIRTRVIVTFQLQGAAK